MPFTRIHSTTSNSAWHQVRDLQRQFCRALRVAALGVPFYLAKRVNAGAAIQGLVAASMDREFHALCTAGEKLRVTDQARCYNHSGDPRRIMIGRGVVIDGIIQCCERGNISIGDFSFIGRSRIYCAEWVQIGDGVLISDGVAIMDSDLHSRNASQRMAQARSWADGASLDSYSGVRSMKVVIGSHAWIGFGACVLKGVTLGEGCIVGAGSVVTADVPAWTIVAGNPARVIGALADHER
jgi:acetyltransferase-like isoleucine patch superfamily enzyme